MRSHSLIFFSAIALFFSLLSCEPREKPEQKTKPRVFEGFHPLLDTIIRTKDGVFRGLNLNNHVADIKKVETGNPVETTPGHLYYEYKVDSATNFSIDYTVDHDSLSEISVQINSNDLELTSYLFCDFKDYYANKLPNPCEDKGYVVYNCSDGAPKPFVISLSDNSSPSRGRINMVIYKDK